MFLRCKVRRKDGKQHRYWSVVQNTRTARGRVVQRHVLYLGEINDTQELAWRRSIELLEEGATQPRTLSLFPEDRCAGRRNCNCDGLTWTIEASASTKTSEDPRWSSSASFG
jgi:hypothetical protein